MLMEIDPLPMRGSMVMTMVTISPSRRDVSPAEQLRWIPRLVRQGSASRWRRFVPKASFLFFFSAKDTLYQKMGIRGLPGGPRGRGARPPPSWTVGGPLWCFLRPIFLIYSKTDFRRVSGLLELCRIGL